jgi:hypothetical protein
LATSTRRPLWHPNVHFLVPKDWQTLVSVVTEIDAETGPTGLYPEGCPGQRGYGDLQRPQPELQPGLGPQERTRSASETISQIHYPGPALAMPSERRDRASSPGTHASAGGTVPQIAVESDTHILAVHDSFRVAVAVCIAGVPASLIRNRERIATEPDA